MARLDKWRRAPGAGCSSTTGCKTSMCLGSVGCLEAMASPVRCLDEFDSFMDGCEQRNQSRHARRFLFLSLPLFFSTPSLLTARLLLF